MKLPVSSDSDGVPRSGELIFFSFFLVAQVAGILRSQANERLNGIITLVGSGIRGAAEKLRRDQTCNTTILIASCVRDFLERFMLALT